MLISKKGVQKIKTNFIRFISDITKLDNTDTSQPPMIEVVLDTGVNWNSVMQVIERRLIETGKMYSKNAYPKKYLCIKIVN